ncbi:transposase [Streptomyces sp. Ag109_O5-10]|uniref:transposase n=1 Tax=Streptomyces sp. Ag109_O5-10 TaxID=1855349 RepID=UPI0015A562BD
MEQPTDHRLRPCRHQKLPVAPRPRRVVRWIMTDPDRLPADDAHELKEIRAACPHLDATARYVRDLAAILHERRGDLLPDWMERVLAEYLPALPSLVTGLRRDQDAVVAGLSSSWSSGQVEGHVTRIKLLKRKGYGRDCVRARVFGLLLSCRDSGHGRSLGIDWVDPQLLESVLQGFQPGVS